MFSLTRWFLVLGLVATAVAVAAPAAFASPEEIAYTCDTDVCLANPDSFNSVVNLTNNGSKSYDEHPVWSPDGKKVAFVGGDPENEADRTQNIYVMEPGKGEASNIALKLTFYTGNVYGNDINYLAWSPDGTRIAFSRTANYGAHAGVFEVAADGTTATPLMLAADGYHPSWAPDGGKIVYSAYSEQLYTVNADGSGTVPLGVKGQEPAWSPDGTQIAFGQVTYSSIYMDLHIVGAGCGASPVVVPIPYPDEYTQWIDARWSPDGSRLSYRSTSGGGYGYERVVGRYGGESHGMVKVQNVNMGGGRAASWSPNGQRLTFDGYSSETSEREIYVGNENGSGSVTSITTGGKNSEPSWRPDPLVSPYVPVICRTVPPAAAGGGAGSGGGPGGKVPGPTRKPKLVWFTKRIPITASGPIHMMIVGCGAPDCGASTRGSAPKGAVAAGLRFRPATSSKKKPKAVVVGTGKLKLHEGQTKTLSMYLNKVGRAALERRGKLDIQATVKITSTGQATVTAKRTIHVVLAKKKPTKKH